MVVYVVVWSIDYSCGAGVEGVFATREAAEDHVRWKRGDTRPYPHGDAGTVSYEIEECEVNGG